MDILKDSKKYFHFHYIDASGIRHRFDEKLKSKQCNHIRSDNSRCLKRCLIGLDLCWIHLESTKKLKINKSRYLRRFQGENGLYAFKRNGGTRRLFKKNDVICNYNGEVINTDELEYRYGNKTGPYAVKISQDLYEDAALQRGVGSMINHTFRQNRINCHLKKRNGRIKIIALKDIKNGTELLTTYGSAYIFDEPNVGTTTNFRVRSL
jgi:hypothetical protein